MSDFINYAHRGASEYLPENTFLSFYTGLYMGANGIETDVRRAKDGTLVLFHDDKLERVTGESGSIEDYTFAELQNFSVKRNGHCDKIVSLEDFLRHFSHFPITFAIELKDADIEKDVAALLRKYKMTAKTVVTSFSYPLIKNFKKIAPEFEIGYLVHEVNEKVLADLQSIGGEEICPHAKEIHAETVKKWHSMGLRVRAWGITKDLMRGVYDAGADGMTVNFPDLLTEYIAEK